MATPPQKDITMAEQNNEVLTQEAFDAMKEELAAMKKQQEILVSKIQVCYKVYLSIVVLARISIIVQLLFLGL